MARKTSTLRTQAALASDYGRMMMEANMVIGIRMMGMAGLWAMPAAELDRMIAEKQNAFTGSAIAATLSAMTGGTPEAIARAALGPIGRKTRSNVKRLTKPRATKPAAP